MPAQNSRLNMDEKAANNGDRLKHALLLEILGRAAPSWPTVVYAETHAGAGVYYQEEQSKQGQQYISDLRALISETISSGSPAPESAGFNYFAALKRWWFEASDDSRP